jgi:hypothetical protein
LQGFLSLMEIPSHPIPSHPIPAVLAAGRCPHHLSLSLPYAARPDLWPIQLNAISFAPIRNSLVSRDGGDDDSHIY